MQTNNQKIYYPAPGDTALAQTQMSMLATSVDSAITQTDGAQSARVDGVEATARALASTVESNRVSAAGALATETAERKAGDEALAVSVNRMAVPDTGWRDIGFDSTLSVAPDSASDKKIPFLHIRRIGNEVMVRGWVSINAGSDGLLANIPTGFRAAPSKLKVGGDDSAYWAYQLPTGYYGDTAPSGQGIVQYTPWKQSIWVTDTSDVSVLVGSGAGFTGSWVADDAFPDVSSLPGTEYTAPVNPNSSTSKVTVDTVNADLQSEKARSQQIDTAQGDRLTKLEAGAVSVKSDVSGLTSTVTQHGSRLLSLEDQGLPELREYVANLVTHQWQTGVGIIYAGSSTAAGTGSGDAGRSWVERINAVLTNRPLSTTVNNSQSRPSNGVQGWQFAVGGTVSDTYLPDDKIAAIQAIKPQLMFHGIGSNNYARQTGHLDFKRNIEAVLARLAQVSPDTRHVFVAYQAANNISNNNPTFKWWQYNEHLRTIARNTPNVYFLDMQPETFAMGLPGLNHWGWYTSDNSHVTSEAHRYYANRILSALGLPVPPANPLFVVWGNTNGGAGKTAGTTLNGCNIGAAAWPRQIVTTGSVFANSESGNTDLRVGSDGSGWAVMRLQSEPLMASFSHSFYIAPGESHRVELQVASGRAYVTSNNQYSNITSAFYPV